MKAAVFSKKLYEKMLLGNNNEKTKFILNTSITQNVLMIFLVWLITLQIIQTFNFKIMI